MPNDKINKITMSVDSVNTTLDIEDATAIHTLKTYNGGKTLGATSGSSSDISLADTPITTSEINALFTPAE